MGDGNNLELAYRGKHFGENRFGGLDKIGTKVDNLYPRCGIQSTDQQTLRLSAVCQQSEAVNSQRRLSNVLRLPQRSGLMFKFQWGKTQRDGADHVLTVPYDDEYVDRRRYERLVPCIAYLSLTLAGGTAHSAR